MRDADLTRISVVVDLWVDTEDYADIIENMDYNFIHPNIKDMEVVDVIYE